MYYIHCTHTWYLSIWVVKWKCHSLFLWNLFHFFPTSFKITIPQQREIKLWYSQNQEESDMQRLPLRGSQWEGTNWRQIKKPLRNKTLGGWFSKTYKKFRFGRLLTIFVIKFWICHWIRFEVQIKCKQFLHGPLSWSYNVHCRDPTAGESINHQSVSGSLSSKR